jgi:signal transduction histidine kinase
MRNTLENNDRASALGTDTVENSDRASALMRNTLENNDRASALVRNTMENNNRTSTLLRSVNGEKGTAADTFTITQPLYYTAGEIEHEEAINIRKHTVLFVEDNIELLYFLVNAVKDKYNVITATNGRKALEKIKKYNKIDIIVSDIMMDEMDGFEFYDELSVNDDYTKIPFIFLTAKTSAREKLKGLRKGAIDFISKPFNMKELSAKIDSLIKIQYLINLFHEKERFASIGRLVSGIAHQILNPLSGITGPLEIFWCNLNKHNLLDERRKEYFHSISESVKKIEDSVKSLRILSYPNNREQEVNLYSIFNSIISLYSREVRSRIQFTLNIDKDFTVITHANDFMNICMNLISNSVDAIEKGGTITVNCIKDKKDLVIEIVDTGCGIKEKDMDFIFEMDFTTKPMGRGTGIGLYIVKELVSKIKWEIAITSEYEKNTTIFLIKRGYYD